MTAMGRDSSVSGRVPIWNAAIKYIEKSPIIGYGIIDSNEFVRASGIPGGTHAHNYILNILIMGGTICLIEHIYMYINIVKHILKNKGLGLIVITRSRTFPFFKVLTFIVITLKPTHFVKTVQVHILSLLQHEQSSIPHYL